MYCYIITKMAYSTCKTCLIQTCVTNNLTHSHADQKIVDKLRYDIPSLQNENQQTVGQGENVDNRTTTM